MRWLFGSRALIAVSVLLGIPYLITSWSSMTSAGFYSFAQASAAHTTGVLLYLFAVSGSALAAWLLDRSPDAASGIALLCVLMSLVGFILSSGRMVGLTLYHTIVPAQIIVLAIGGVLAYVKRREILAVPAVSAEPPQDTQASDPAPSPNPSPAPAPASEPSADAHTAPASQVFADERDES